MSKFLPVFSGGVFGNSELIIAQTNFIFDTVEELEKAHEERPFEEFFPFPTTYARIHEIDDKGFEGVPVNIGGAKLFCIGGEIYESVE